MTLRGFIDRLIGAKDALIRNREDDVLRLALDMQALVQLRIQTTGENAQGRAFTPYSPGYAKNRRDNGYQAGYVDFTRTGEMWRSVGPKIISSNVFGCKAEIRARDSANQQKLDAALRKPAAAPRGNILQPSAEEIDALKQANNGRLLKYIQI